MKFACFALDGTQIPNMFSALQNSSVDWGYHVERSHKAGRAIANEVVWSRGKFIGGSGGMNVMLYVRGNSRDYDNWELMGNPSWGWQNVTEYFKKIENIEAPELTANNSNHGTDGLLKINWVQNEEPFKQLLFNASKELGYNQILDINGNDHMGMGSAPAMIDQGMPASPAKAFLAPAKDRANLHVIKHAFVTKVHVENSTGQVTGVEFIVNNTTTMTVRASKEVILSAGSVGTPTLLQLSGIGAEKYLRRLNISLVRDLKVGFSLQDHLYAPIFLKFNASQSVEATPTDSADDLYNYIKHKDSAFSTKRIFDVIGFFNTVNVTDIYPNVGTQYVVFKRGEISILTQYLNQLGYNDSVAQPILDANNVADVAAVFVVLLNPQALGKIRLNSTDPFVAPRIQPNYLDRREDVATLVQGIQLTRNFYNTTAFTQNEVTEINMNVAPCQHMPQKKIKSKPPKPVKPTKPPKTPKNKHGKKYGHTTTTTTTTAAPPVQPLEAAAAEPIAYGSDQYWECYVRHFATSLHHPVGTAKMGPANDPYAVVDSQLNVHGLRGLRVIDASIMPKIISGNINTATIMIAEKGSDFIKRAWENTLQPTDTASQIERNEL